MRTIRDLIETDKKVYIYLQNKAIEYRFMSDAEREGITYGDGIKPTERPVDDIYSCLFPNSYVRVRYLSTTPHAQGIHQALVCETSPWESHPRRVLRRLRREVSLTPVLVIATTESNSASTT